MSSNHSLFTQNTQRKQTAKPCWRGVLLDLNLIRVFAAVYESGTVTGAAQALQMSQPSVTQALHRLRRLTGDELFIKSGRTIAPTRGADQLYREIGHLPASAEAAVGQLVEFTPRTSVETFRIALTDIGQMIFLPTLVSELAQVAPKSKLDVVNLDASTAPHDLTSGKIDIAVASTLLSGRLETTVLRPDIYCCVVRKGRFGSVAPTFDELTSLPRVVARNTTGHSLVESFMPPPVEGSIYLPAFAAIPEIVSRSELIAFAPQAVVQHWARGWQIEAWPLPSGPFTSIVRAHTAARKPATAASAWFTQWAIQIMQNTKDEDELDFVG